MLLKYFYDTALAHASYMVGCQKTGEAILIDPDRNLSLIHISEPTRQAEISYAVFCLKKKK